MTTPSLTTQDMSTCYAQVLAPVDFSPMSWRILPLAKAMSRAFGVPRRLLHVDTASPWLDEPRHHLQFKRTPTGEPVDVEVVAARDATDGIVRVLGDDESSLLVMSTHGHTAAAELAMGSTTEALLRIWRGAVLAAGPHFVAPHVPVSRIVLCVEPGTSPPVELVEDVRAWGARFDVHVVLLMVTDYSMATDFEWLRVAQQQQLALADLLGRDQAPVSIETRQSTRPAHTIVEYADHMPGTILAMGTRARPVASRLVLGSVAMAVLRHAKTPVLLRRNEARDHSSR